ncbi:MAG: CinA family nicotinamide mononucleotide deamidase-related protein [Rhodopirellula sp.]|nr:CinA family nicotinamide mononucleotide deamidase-related protein [Rhodopirellula sp.]
MKAEIISIGSELTSGAKLDTNSQWLSTELSEIGIPVHFHSTMADDRQTMLEVFQTAVRRSDIVLVTGGLGPTLDDLTRELIAELTGTELVLDEASLQFIQDLFEKRGRVMADRNRIQAMFPAGSEVLQNPVGTAPGVWMEIPRAGRAPSLLAAMPGVPSEMKIMFKEQVLPRLPGGQRVIRRRSIHCFGEGESNIEAMLGDLTARNRNPEVGITASSATISLRIAAHGASIEECDHMIAETQSLVSEKLGTLIFGEDDHTLEAVVVGMLRARGQAITTVEAGTRGLLAQMLSTAPGADSCFLGGVVLNASPSVVISLGDDGGAVDATNSDAGSMSLVSAEETLEMAQNARRRFESDFALAISPFTEPSVPGEPATSFIALAGEHVNEVHEHRILVDPAIARPRAAKGALNLLRRHLLESEA